MSKTAVFDKIDISLIRVLHTVITECSVSGAARRLRSSQPAVSMQLKRLRDITGDPLLVRCGQTMAPTDVALSLLEPAAAILTHAQRMFGHTHGEREFDPASSTITFRIAATDYLDPFFLPELTLHLKRLAPGLRVEFVALSGELDYRRSLARGEVDLVIGNWHKPSDELHRGRLLTDEVVCLVSEEHPAAHPSVSGKPTWGLDQYLGAEHVAPPSFHPGGIGVIDEHLAMRGLKRNIVVRNPHFSQLPYMVAGSKLVLTTGRHFCERYAQQLRVKIVKCPVSFPAMNYYQLWHDLSHHSAAGSWLRDQVLDVVRHLQQIRPPWRAEALPVMGLP